MNLVRWHPSAARARSINEEVERTWSLIRRNTRSARDANLIVPGGVAQLVERYVRNVEVGGSSPLTSTKSPYSNSDVEKSVSNGS